MVSVVFNIADQKGNLCTADFQDGVTMEMDTMLKVRDEQQTVVAIIPIHVLLYASVKK